MTLQRLPTRYDASTDEQSAWFWRAFRAAQESQRRRRIAVSRGDRGATGPFIPSVGTNTGGSGGGGGGGGGGVPLPLPVAPRPIVPNLPPTAFDAPGGFGIRFPIPRGVISRNPLRTPFIDFPPYKYKKIPGKKARLRPLILFKNAPKGTPTMLPDGAPLPSGVLAPVGFASLPWGGSGGSSGGGGGTVLAWH